MSSWRLGVIVLAGVIAATVYPVRSTAQKLVAFSEDIAPLLFRECVTCHRPGGSGTFSLLTYDDAKRRGRQIVVVTAARRMPPWKPEPGHGDFEGRRWLSAAEIELFKAWANDGFLEGDPLRAPPPPKWHVGWERGEPDLILRTPVYTLRAGGPDVFRNFVISVPTDISRYIKAWEFQPGNTKVVHHATMQIDPTAISRQFDDQDPEPGYEGLIAPSARTPEGFFLDWAPGHGPGLAVRDTAWPLPTNSDLLMMLHLRPSGKEETVQASLGLYFADNPPAKLPVMLRLTRQDLDIAPGQRQHEVTAAFTLPVDVDAYTVQPHAHYLAREIKGHAELPDRTTKPLIYIKDWDFNWQGVYHYASPVFLPAGTTVVMRVIYDNSIDNPRNPFHPPRRVTYGQNTSDEMAELWLQVVPRNASDRPVLTKGLHAKVLNEEITGRRMMVERDPGNIGLRDDLGVLLAEAGRFQEAAEEFALSLLLKPDSPAARFNVGAALLEAGQPDEARRYFEAALQADAKYPLAHHRLALLLWSDGDTRAAVDHLRRALKEKPEWERAQSALAWILAVSDDATALESAEAVQIATNLVESTGRQNVTYLDILATAFAAVGEFRRAIATEQAAVAIAAREGTDRQIGLLRHRLELFKRHVPYTER